MKMEQYALGEKFAGEVADARGVALPEPGVAIAEWLPTEDEIRAGSLDRADGPRRRQWSRWRRPDRRAEVTSDGDDALHHRRRASTISFIGPDRALHALVRLLRQRCRWRSSDLLERVAQFSADLRDRVMSGLAVFDEHNIARQLPLDSRRVRLLQPRGSARLPGARRPHPRDQPEPGLGRRRWSST